MPNLRRIALLATIVASLVLAPVAGAAVGINAPTEVTAPGKVPFSATASPDSQLTFLVDGKRQWSAGAGADGLQRSGVVKLAVGSHRLEVRERQGTHVTAKRRVTRVVSKPSKPIKGSTPSPAGTIGESSSVSTRTSGSSDSSSTGGSSSGSLGSPKPTAPVRAPESPPPAKSPEIPTTPSTPEVPSLPTTPTTPTNPVTESTYPGALFASSVIPAFQVNHSAPGAISEVPDPLGSGSKVIQMTVSDQDVYPVTPTENPRAELVSQPLVNPGQEVWLHTRFLIPTDYPTVPDGGWVSLVSFYGAPFNGPSPFHLEVDGNQLQWQRNETYGFDVPYKSTLITGQWNDVLVHEKFASEGFLELWINGQPINFFSSGGFNPTHHAATTKLEMATMDASNNAAPNAAKIMQYRKMGMFQSGTIYFSGLQVGASRTSVGA